jgi:hypothetical protein
MQTRLDIGERPLVEDPPGVRGRRRDQHEVIRAPEELPQRRDRRDPPSGAGSSRRLSATTSIPKPSARRATSTPMAPRPSNASRRP